MEIAMKKIVLNGENIHSESDFHKQIATLLGFSQYYGENLDALWDCLSYDVERPVLIIWNNSDCSKRQLGEMTFNNIIIIFQLVKEQDIDSNLTEKINFELR